MSSRPSCKRSGRDRMPDHSQMMASYLTAFVTVAWLAIYVLRGLGREVDAEFAQTIKWAFPFVVMFWLGTGKKPG
jgi:hypothetical protein